MSDVEALLGLAPLVVGTGVRLWPSAECYITHDVSESGMDGSVIFVGYRSTYHVRRDHRRDGCGTDCRLAHIRVYARTELERL